MRDFKLTSRARSMRKEMTEPETRIWLKLRAKRFGEVKFRRQKVIANYIADFAANNPKLVIELDGESHAGQGAYDARRTSAIEAEGYQVLRFTNLEVMTNIDGVLAHIAEVIVQCGEQPPHPTLSPEGERAS